MSKLNKQLLIAGAIVALAIIVYLFFFFSRNQDQMQTAEYVHHADPSIAVIPFVNISKDSNQEYFSDGLTDEIRNSLSHLSGLKVSARASSIRFKGKTPDIHQIGKELAVHEVLEGTMKREGDHIRITVQLINAETGHTIWSQHYEENLDDIFNIQRQIIQSIAERLEVALLGNNQQTASKIVATNAKSYELYLRGRESWNRRTPPELRKAIDLFRQAISLDTGYAAAYSGIADCYNALGYGSYVAPGDAFPKAMEAALRAIQLDPTLAEPHASLGYYKFYYEWDWAEAEQEFRQAIALNQNYELGYDWYGYYLTSMRRFSEAKIILSKAAELDPLSAPVSTDMGFSSYYSSNYDSAIAELHRALQINPNLPLTHLWLGRSFQAKKSFPEAIAEYKRALQVDRHWPVALAQIGNVYGVSGDTTNARKILDSLIVLSSDHFVTAYGMALVYAGLNQNEMALLWLNKAYDEHSHWMVWLKLDPRWVNITNDKRYITLVNKLAFPKNQ